MANYTYITMEALAIVKFPYVDEEYEKEKWCTNCEKVKHEQSKNRKMEGWENFKFCSKCASELEVRMGTDKVVPDGWYEWSEGPNTAWKQGNVSSTHLQECGSRESTDALDVTYLKTNAINDGLDYEKISENREGGESFNRIDNPVAVEKFKEKYGELVEKLRDMVDDVEIEYAYGVLKWTE